ncbi:OmpA family protein [Ichthyenterobacterium sp. W332]|uniref:OmpA family protein n=1 Tax=Microcosmobacter mediterraneus TaxID=3075607 RepID=A0ABU2YJH7_9FLAO|nr:OmpA family protein [Ichthyenterobacterium sp. W332]MDT0558192.1 OmpA family protein [Ichthyenterobacterium sp. W332]
MSKKTTYLLGILLTIILGTFLYWKFCCGCCKEDSCDRKDKIEETVVDNNFVETKKTTVNPFAFKDDNGDFSLNIDDNFNFNASQFSLLDSISGNVNDGIIQLKDYLDTNNLKRLNITGYYTSEETNNSAFPNLGLARANAVKNHFISKGVSSRLINTYGKLNDDLVPNADNVFFGPLDFGISTRVEGNTADGDALKASCEAIKANPLVLYFNTGEAAINLTVEQRQKIADISRCVDKMGVKVQVVGHTDNTGDAANNVVLGQQRADFAKNYLIRNGILSGNIVTSSKGQTEPIADNTTEEGKTKNRRTVVTIN